MFCCDIILIKHNEGVVAYMKWKSVVFTNEYEVKLKTFKELYIVSCSFPFFGPFGCLACLTTVSYSNERVNASKNHAVLVATGYSLLVQALFWSGVFLTSWVSWAFIFLMILSIPLGIVIGIKTCKKYTIELENYNKPKGINFDRSKYSLPSLLSECDNDLSKVWTRLDELLKDGTISSREYEMLSNELKQMMLEGVKNFINYRYNSNS